MAYTIIVGTNGNDTLNVPALNEGGDYILKGLGGDDTLNGAFGDDILEGGIGNDTLNGNDGNDFLNGGNGVDTLNGGNGVDLLSYVSSPSGVRVFLLEGEAEDGFGNIDIISNFENIRGSQSDDVIFGDHGNNTIFGDAGPDLLVGYGGNDNIHGGAGNDVIDGDGHGGVDGIPDGIDDVSYNNATSAVTVNLLDNRATNDGFGNIDLIFNIENINGSQFNDNLSGNNVDNIIRAGSGNDTINGGFGNDSLFGGPGDDIINGQAGLDRIFGGVGNDTVNGGSGIDLLSGGPGLDRIFGGSQDTVIYSYVTTRGVSVDLLAGTGGDGMGDADLLFGVVNVVGSDFGDVLTGTAARNSITGGLGSDTLTGGAAADRFIFNFFEQGVVDTITDFMHSQSDKIQIGSSFGANNSRAGFSYNSFTGALSFMESPFASLSTESGFVVATDIVFA